MFHQNQLQFNLDVPSLPNNLAARYHNPGPLVIEKLGSGTAESREPKEPPVKLTTISEDRLSTAVKLAKLDLKNILAKNQTPDVNGLLDGEQKVAKKSKSKLSGKTHRQLRDSSLRLQERYADPNESRRSVETQTQRAKRRHAKDVFSSQPENTYGLILNARDSQHGNAKKGGPANRVSLSPPTKDIALSPNSRQAQEIRRLRSELKTYMKKVEELSIKASQQKAQTGKKDEEDAEDVPRRAARAAEQASRSARLLYSLQQQVREIQEELDKLGPGKVRHTKKSRALNRLAAAHRGAVRALQSFLHHLPSEMDPGSGLPPHYQELALLIRQLSLCCSQLDLEESGIPEGVLNILEQAKDFQDAVSQQISSPPKPKQATQPRLSPRRQLDFEDNAVRVPSEKPSQRARTLRSPVADWRAANMKVPHPHPHRVRETPVRDTNRYRDTSFDTPRVTPRVTPGPTTVERLRRSVVNSKATPGSPERNKALRAGLEALLRAGGYTPVLAHPTRPTTSLLNPGFLVPRPAAKARKQPPAKGYAPPSKSLILPAKLKADRERLQRARTIPRDAHFTQETLASKLKHRDLAGHGSSLGTDSESRSQDDGGAAAPKPAWTPPGSPRSFHKASPRPRRAAASSDDEEESKQDGEHSPRRRKVIFNLEDGDEARRDGARGLDVGLMQREIARQAWLDREAAKQVKHAGREPKADLAPPVPSHWLEKAERALADRLGPLIDKAETAAKEQQRLENRTRQSLHQQLSQRAVQATSNNADILSDLLLEDILADTALEFHRIEADEKLEQQARQLQDAPTVEGMLQSLEKMELVEDEIRRRWKRVEYIDQEEPLVDSSRHREARRMLGTPLDGEFLESFPGALPTTHTSMQFTNVHPQSGRGEQPSMPSADDRQVSSGTDDVPLPSSNSEDSYNMGVQPLPLDEIRYSEVDSKDGRRYVSQDDGADSVSHASRAALNPTHHMNILQNLLGSKASSAERQKSRHTVPSSHKESDTGPTLDRPTFPVFIPNDMMNRIREHRGRFEHHLKSTSHWAYGTFDPWRLVEEVSDEIVSEIIKDVSSEVGDIMSHCVDDLYKAEFDMT